MLNLLAPYKLYAVAGLVILIALILGLHLYADNRLRKQRDNAISELSAFKTAIAIETKTRELDIANKRIAGAARTKLIEAEYEAELKSRDLDRAKSTQAIKDFYEKRLNIINFNADERVRINAERGRLGLPAKPSATEKPTEGGGECHTAAFENLERACAITTLDFNACRAALDNDTAIVGRDE